MEESTNQLRTTANSEQSNVSPSFAAEEHTTSFTANNGSTPISTQSTMPSASTVSSNSSDVPSPTARSSSSTHLRSTVRN